MNGKRWYLSKTLWIAAITFLLSLAAALSGDVLISQNPTAVWIIGMVVAFLTAINRTITVEPIKVGKSLKMLILALMAGSLMVCTAFAEGWTPPDEATTPDDAALCKQLVDNPGLGIKERRDMGITIKNIRAVTKKLKAEGKLAGLDRTEVSALVMSELVAQNPKAFADPKLDWDKILQFIEMILKILALFGGL